MKKKDAEKLLPLVNQKGALDALEHYIALRIEALKEDLVHQSPLTEQQRGAIYELRRFKHLRDEVLNAKDE